MTAQQLTDAQMLDELRLSRINAAAHLNTAVKMKRSEAEVRMLTSRVAPLDQIGVRFKALAEREKT